MEFHRIRLEILTDSLWDPHENHIEPSRNLYRILCGIQIVAPSHLLPPKAALKATIALNDEDYLSRDPSEPALSLAPSQNP